MITVTGVDVASTITGNTIFSGDAGDAVRGDLNAVDPDGLTDLSYFTIKTDGTFGTAAIHAETGAWTYSPASSNWFGTDSFTVTVTDDEGGVTDRVVNIALAERVVEIEAPPEVPPPPADDDDTAETDTADDEVDTHPEVEEEPVDDGQDGETEDAAKTGEPDKSLDESSSARSPIFPGEIVLSVMHERNTNGNSSDLSAVKPSVESARTFIQELHSFWVAEQPEVAAPPQFLGQSESFWVDLDKMRVDMSDDAEEVDQKLQLNAEAAAGLGISLTAGFVSWALRAGSMVASFLAAMPTWRNFDPMPVLGADEARQKAAASDSDKTLKDADENEEDAKVDAMFDR